KPVTSLRNKRAANLPSEIRAHRNVLQIRIAARKTSGRCRCLMKRCVQTCGFGIDEFWNDVNVGRLEFCKLAIFENEPGQLVLFGQFFENLDGGRILAGLPKFSRSRQIELIEEDLAELTR